ncbi:hypothetical protein BJY01DRAFT_259225 [Aspergillus pseudoustus]|uniref:Carrier domain-containing protein n=1 Tax=Aspergillus pseudoustus TaxID=1810923 RepID=A0ABR4J6L7_9EURO
MSTTDSQQFNPQTQLLPHIVDHYAATKPKAIYAEYPVSLTTYADGYRPITFKAFANAINGIAWWLSEKLGPGDGEILAYVGPNDLRYPVLVLGAIKAGYVMFLTSPRNSVAAHSSLFERLSCTKLVSPVPRPPPVTAILEARALDVLDVPSVDELLTTKYPHFGFTKTYADAALETVAVIHTSGSTGIPKPIFWTHDAACTHMHTTLLDPPADHESQDRRLFGKRMFVVPPPFHAAGLAYSLFISIPVGTTIIFPTSAGLPTAAGLVEARKQTRIDILLGVPSIIEELSQSDELLDYCSRNMERLIYCGGDLPQRIGDTVAARIPLMNLYGASEVGMVSTIASKTDRDPRTDWRYIHINPRMGAQMRHVADGEHELVLVRGPELERHQFCFAVFPDRSEYRTNDLFVRHPDPSKQDLWRWSARADDVIVFLNGEKTNPVSMEQHVASSNAADVSAVLVAGARRFQASLLVELRATAIVQENRDCSDLSASDRAAIIEKLWSSIEEANAVCPAHARIAKTHILFAKRDKPFLRAGKGTIQRAGTLALYEAELDALYADADELAHGDRGQDSGSVAPARLDDPLVLSGYIRQTMLDITGWGEDRLSASNANKENFFHLGLDSLQAITAARRFRRGLDMPDFSPNLIYLHPSVAELSEAVIRLRCSHEASSEATRIARLHEREKLLEGYSKRIIPRKLESTTPRHTSPDQKNHTVILTGSTGNLGTYILDALLNNPSVSHVHCLNRRSDAADVQRQKNQAASLTSLDEYESRASFWAADLSQADLGLGPDVLKTLQKTATAIIHNAWPVNFNLSLSSFEPSLAGVVNLINFVNTQQPSVQPTHLFFISSISSTMNHRTETGLTPESIITTESLGPNGYAESKYIAEHLLNHANVQEQDTSLRGSFSFARVGQVAGPVRAPGIWNHTEWFPSLVLSSLHVGALPNTLGAAMDRVDWMPVDLLARVLVDLALESGDEREGVNVYHPVNTHPVSWTDIRPVVAEILARVSGKTVETISFREWIQRVRTDVESLGASAGAGSKVTETELKEALARSPAAKLLQFFEGIMAETESGSVLDTTVTAQLSDKLSAVDAIKPDWIEKWVTEWLSV